MMIDPDRLIVREMKKGSRLLREVNLTILVEDLIINTERKGQGDKLQDISILTKAKEDLIMIKEGHMRHNEEIKGQTQIVSTRDQEGIIIKDKILVEIEDLIIITKEVSITSLKIMREARTIIRIEMMLDQAIDQEVKEVEEATEIQIYLEINIEKKSIISQIDMMTEIAMKEEEIQESLIEVTRNGSRIDILRSKEIIEIRKERVIEETINISTDSSLKRKTVIG